MPELRLDWYEATLECDVLTVLAIASLAGTTNDGEAPKVTVARGMHGYKRKHIIEGNGLEVTILDLGTDGWPHIMGTGHNADRARIIAKASANVGRVSRVDVACDAIEPWWKAQGRAVQWAIAHPNTPVTHVGDYLRAERGRTFYVGATSSARRIRVYEKGIQTGGNPEWVRVELQYRPDNRNAKAWAYSATLEELASSSRAFVALRADAGLYTPPAYQPPGRQPLIALAHQYGNVLREQVPDAWRIIVNHLQHDWTPNAE